MDDLEQYAQRDDQAQGEHYLRHVSAMTGEGLHAKSAIAGELAHRDIEIARLTAERDALQAKLDESQLNLAAEKLTSKHYSKVFRKVQRKYDALMMECCPDAMTPEQKARWGK